MEDVFNIVVDESRKVFEENKQEDEKEIEGDRAIGKAER